MIGVHPRPKSTLQNPPRDAFDDPMAHIYSPHSPACVPVNFINNAGGGDCSPVVDTSTALQRYLPSNEFVSIESDSPSEDSDVPVDAFSCDKFRIYEFKVRKCARGRSHDWTECPYAHPGEKARRRDPRRYHYSGTACPEFRKGSCRKGDSCEFAHGVFECWLHPARYRTQPCKDGPGCRRRVCFFAHSPEQLRVFTQQNPRTKGSGESFSANDIYMDSPTSVSPPPNSSPTSPSSQQLGSAHFNSVSELTMAVRNFRLDAMKTSPSLRGFQMGSELGSPRNLKQCIGFISLPSTPTQVLTRSGLNPVGFWEQICGEEEPVMERVESERDLRAKIYAKLRKQNSPGFVDSAAAGPDVEWVSELVN